MRAPLPSWTQTIFVVLISLLITGLAFFTGGSETLGIDFVQYWSAAHVLRAGGDPYNESLLLSIQNEYYPSLTTAIRMWNPPLTLTLALPFSWFGYHTALFIWMNAIIVITGVSLLALCAEWKSPRLSRPQIYFLGIFLASYFPAASALAYGQISPILLAGFVGWLCMRRTAPFLAGMALSLTLCKPHLLYLVYFAIFVKSLSNRDFSVIFGALFGAILLLITPVLLQPDILSWYLHAAASPPIHFQTPTLGSWLQRADVMPPEIARITPTIIITGWYLLLILLRRGQSTDVYLLAPISLISSPYGWPFDQLLLAPTALQVLNTAVIGSTTEQRRCALGSACLLLANCIAIAFAPGRGMEIFVWYPAALATIYYVSMRSRMPTTP